MEAAGASRPDPGVSGGDFFVEWQLADSPEASPPAAGLWKHGGVCIDRDRVFQQRHPDEALVTAGEGRLPSRVPGTRR